MNPAVSDYRRFHPQIIHVLSGQTSSDFRYTQPKRICAFYEIELITASCGGGVITPDGLLPAVPGTVFIRSPGSIVNVVGQFDFCSFIFDSCYDPAREPYYTHQISSLNFLKTPDFMTDTSDSGHRMPFLDQLGPCVQVKDIRLYQSCFENAFHAFVEGSEDAPLLILKELLTVITMLIQEQAEHFSSAKSTISKNLLEVKNYIDLHYREPLTLELLASRVSLSREHLCRQFRKFYGLTPMEYLKSIRMFQAKFLLSSTSSSVSEIVNRCGFSSEQYFYMQFKKEMHLSPLQYRKTHMLTAQKNK